MAIQYTTVDGNCPNPMELLNAQYAQLAGKIRDLVCSESFLGKQYTDSQVQDLQAQITALSENEDLLEKLGELQTFLDSLDTNGDGKIDLVVSLQKEIDDLKSDLANVRDIANKNTGDISALKTDVDSFKTTTNNSINQLNTGLLEASNQAHNATQSATTAAQEAAEAQALAQAAEGLTKVNTNEIAELKSDLANIVSFDEERAQQMAEAQTCYIFSTIRDGMNAGMSVFDEALLKGCSVYTDAPAEDVPPAEDGSDAPAEDVPPAEDGSDAPPDVS